MAMQATLSIPEPRNWRQAMESPEWDEGRNAEETEMPGIVENCVYKQVARPNDKLVVGTKMLYKRKIGEDGKVEKYKCRLVAQGFWQVEGIHYTEKFSPTPATASIRMFLAMVQFNDWGGRGCNILVPVLGGNGTKIAPTGGISDQLPRQMR